MENVGGFNYQTLGFGFRIADGLFLYVRAVKIFLMIPVLQMVVLMTLELNLQQNHLVE